MTALARLFLAKAFVIHLGNPGEQQSSAELRQVIRGAGTLVKGIFDAVGKAAGKSPE